MYAVFIYYPGSNWQQGKSIFEQALEGHASYMSKLEQEGILRIGGAFTNSAGAMGILNVDTFEQAKALVQQDPAIQNKIMKADIHPWQPSVAQKL